MFAQLPAMPKRSTDGDVEQKRQRIVERWETERWRVYRGARTAEGNRGLFVHRGRGEEIGDAGARVRNRREVGTAEQLPWAHRPRKEVNCRRSCDVLPAAVVRTAVITLLLLAAALLLPRAYTPPCRLSLLRPRLNILYLSYVPRPYGRTRRRRRASARRGEALLVRNCILVCASCTAYVTLVPRQPGRWVSSGLRRPLGKNAFFVCRTRNCDILAVYVMYTVYIYMPHYDIVYQVEIFSRWKHRLMVLYLRARMYVFMYVCDSRCMSVRIPPGVLLGFPRPPPGPNMLPRATKI